VLRRARNFVPFGLGVQADGCISVGYSWLLRAWFVLRLDWLFWILCLIILLFYVLSYYNKIIKITIGHFPPLDCERTPHRVREEDATVMQRRSRSYWRAVIVAEFVPRSIARPSRVSADGRAIDPGGRGLPGAGGTLPRAHGGRGVGTVRAAVVAECCRLPAPINTVLAAWAAAADRRWRCHDNRVEITRRP